MKSRATTTTSSEAAAPSTKRKVEKATTAAAVAQKPTRSILFALDTKPPSTAVGQSSSSSSSSGAVVEIGPARGRPCLQSSRLYSTSYMPLAIESGSHIGTSNANPALSKRLVEKMNSYLRELEIPENPLPTRAVCDLVEAVKRKTVTLMSLHNTITKTRRDHERAKTQSQEVVTVGMCIMCCCYDRAATHLHYMHACIQCRCGIIMIDPMYVCMMCLRSEVSGFVE